MWFMGLRDRLKSSNNRKETDRATAAAPATSRSISSTKFSLPAWATSPFTKAKSTTPIPSLNRDSLSMTVVTFLDMPSLFIMPVAAIGSVGDTMHPKRIHSQISRGHSSRQDKAKNKIPYKMADTAVVRNDSSVMAFRLEVNFPKRTLPAPANSMKHRTPSNR